MIQANQYRLGNYMRDKLTGEWMIIEDLSLGNVAATVINRAKFPLPDGWQMEPIPLSPEILTACGFVYLETQQCHMTTVSDEDFQLRYDDYGLYLRTFSDRGQEAIATQLPIQYLHQLQNLYFALTGSELPISLPTQ